MWSRHFPDRGFSLLEMVIVLLIVAAWLPQIAWLIVPVLLGFLGLQLLRWLEHYRQQVA